MRQIAAGRLHALRGLAPDTMSFNPLTVPNLPYNPDTDFVPIIDMYHVMEGLMVPAAGGVDTLDALRAKAVAAPGKLNYGTLGERTTTDAFRQWLGDYWHTKFVAIPYKGGSEIISALLGNDIDVTKIGVGNMVSQLKEGKIKILALNAAKRSPDLPNVPTFKETGLDGFPGGPIFWGIVVPTGTPAPIVAQAARRTAGDLPEPEIHRLRPAELSRPGRRLDRRLRRLPQEGPPGRQGGGRHVYEVTARRGVIPGAVIPDCHRGVRNR